MKLPFKYGIFPLIILLMLACRPGQSDRTNKIASPTAMAGLPENPLEMIPMAVSVKPETKTMSTLYGNSIAASGLKDGKSYGSGSVLYLVSWKGQADPDWFGARIPAQVTAIERVSIGQRGKKDYNVFKGPAWDAGVDVDKEIRLAAILSIPIATSP